MIIHIPKFEIYNIKYRAYNEILILFSANNSNASCNISDLLRLKVFLLGGLRTQ
jgi:hypothetical protein